jgi:hypothetical protein
MVSNKRRAPNVSQTDIYGLKFIRMIIASYCIAVSLGVIGGFNTSVLFAPFFSPELASLLGSTFVLYCAALLFLGLFLRLTSLWLAMAILSSGLDSFLFATEASSIDMFWRDVVLASAVLLNYWALNENARNKQSTFRLHKPVRRVMQGAKIKPVRVSAKSGTTRREYDKAVRLTQAEFARRAEQTELPAEHPKGGGNLAKIAEFYKDDLLEEEQKNLFA